MYCACVSVYIKAFEPVEYKTVGGKMPWRRQPERSELVHVVVTGHQKRKYPRKYYVSFRLASKQTQFLGVGYDIIHMQSYEHMQVFVIDVTWNNSDRFEIYRRYSEFFSFQVYNSLSPVGVDYI